MNPLLNSNDPQSNGILLRVKEVLLSFVPRWEIKGFSITIKCPSPDRVLTILTFEQFSLVNQLLNSRAATIGTKCLQDEIISVN